MSGLEAAQLAKDTQAASNDPVVTVVREDGYWLASVTEIPGYGGLIGVDDDSREEALKMLVEALWLSLVDTIEHG